MVVFCLDGYRNWKDIIEAISQCEKELPRDQFCDYKVIAFPKKE